MHHYIDASVHTMNTLLYQRKKYLLLLYKTFLKKTRESKLCLHTLMWAPAYQPMRARSI